MVRERDTLYNTLARLLGTPWSVLNDTVPMADLRSLSVWEGICCYAVRQKVSGALAYVVERYDIPESPGNTRKTLAEQYRSIKASNLFQMDNAGKVFDAFEENGILVAVVKGHVLIRHLYPSQGMRLPGDIDLVVRKADLAAARELLRSLGYRSIPFYEDRLEKKGCLTVDLHTSFTGCDRIKNRALVTWTDTDCVFSRSLPFLDNYSHVRMPAWDDHLILACAHAEKHAYCRMSLFYDIPWMLEKVLEGSSPGELAEKTLEWNATRPLYVCVRYIREKFGFAVPETLSRPLEGRVSFSLPERLMLERVMNGGRLGMTGSLLPVFSVKGWGNRLSLLWEMAFPRPGVMTQVSGESGSGRGWKRYSSRLMDLLKNFAGGR